MKITPPYTSTRRTESWRTRSIVKPQDVAPAKKGRDAEILHRVIGISDEHVSTSLYRPVSKLRYFETDHGWRRRKP